jgi:hypothetical protein
MTVWDITPQHPKGFGGHDFVHRPEEDLFRCARCEQYEILVRDKDSGEIQPCPNAPVDTSRPAAPPRQ